MLLFMLIIVTDAYYSYTTTHVCLTRLCRFVKSTRRRLTLNLIIQNFIIYIMKTALNINNTKRQLL